MYAVYVLPLSPLSIALTSTHNAPLLLILLLSPHYTAHRYKKDPQTHRLSAALWATDRMRDLAQQEVRFMSFDTTHQLNWQDMYTGVLVTENLHGDTEVLAYSVQVCVGCVCTLCLGPCPAYFLGGCPNQYPPPSRACPS